MGISDQFKDKAEQLQQQGKERAQGMKDEAQQRMQQRKGKKQGESERGREDMSMRDRQSAMDEDYEV
ncbi:MULTISPECIES: hypothetical protein [unclassified Streptomyces]|uniref:hypothetical protein n=1 Tax=unclassified Streptomyces TaxID=2593676 RepID=UPI0033E5F2F6